MKKTKFKNIHSLEDIKKVKNRLKKKVRVTEKSVSEKTDFGKLLLGSLQKAGNLTGAKNNSREAIGYLLPVGLNYIIKLLEKKTNKKQVKRLLIYSAAGGILAFSVYHILGKRHTETEE